MRDSSCGCFFEVFEALAWITWLHNGCHRWSWTLFSVRWEGSMSGSDWGSTGWVIHQKREVLQNDLMDPGIAWEWLYFGIAPSFFTLLAFVYYLCLWSELHLALAKSYFLTLKGDGGFQNVSSPQCWREQNWLCLVGIYSKVWMHGKWWNVDLLDLNHCLGRGWMVEACVSVILSLWEGVRFFAAIPIVCWS